MVKRMSLNDVQFRQIMVGDNTAEFGDREEINMATKKVKQISAYSKWVLTKLAMIKDEQSSMDHKDSVNN